MTRFRLDPTWRRPNAGQPGAGQLVIAGSPLRLFRLSPGGAHVIAQVEAGEAPATAAVRQLLDRFVEAGALHPVPEPAESPFTADDVTFVIPAFADLPTGQTTFWARFVSDIETNQPQIPEGRPEGRPGGGLEGVRVIVVDDASPTPLAVAATHSDGDSTPSVTWLRHDTNRGPGAARNTGLAHVTTSLVAFVDTDVALPAGWLEPLLAHFADDRVALVAPRVTSAPGPGRLAAYETRHSPLDLGDQPARIAAGTRVSYVPAAVLVCRTDSLRELGGFDEGLRFGEDVDLLWRLTEAGYRARYEPASVVLHSPRSTWGELWRQRFGYGRSAAPLAQRHRRALAPVRMSGWSAAVWVLVALRRPWPAIAVAAGTLVALQRKLGDVPARESARLVGLGHLAAGGQFARAITRVWWPVAAALALVSRRARLPIAIAVVAPRLGEALRSRSLTPLADSPARLADEMAYGAGLWAGVIGEREVGPLVPEFTTWPQRGGR